MVEGPPQDPGEVAIEGWVAAQLLLLLFVPLVLGVFVVERLHGGRAPRATWVLVYLGVMGALSAWVPLLAALGAHRERARRLLIGLAPPLALSVPAGFALGGAPWLTVGLLGLATGSVALGAIRKLRRPDVVAVFARGPRHDPDQPSLLLTWAGWGGVLTLFVLLNWLQLVVRRETGALLSGTLASAATVLGALAGAGLMVGTAFALRELRRRARSDPALTPPATRARLLALRAEGKSLRQLAHALESEGHAPPGGGRWTGSICGSSRGASSA